MRRAPLLVLLLALPVTAQDDRLARVAERYATVEWPAAGPARAGVGLEALEPPAGWKASGFQVDPRRAEGTLRLSSPDGGEVGVTARLFADAAQARAALLSDLSNAQRLLDRQPGVGEVAYASHDAKGRPVLLLAARGNVAFEARAVGPRERLAPDALLSVAQAVDRLVQSAPPLEPGAALPAPRILAVQVAPARAGQPAAIRLDVDPSAPAPRHVLIACSGDAGAVQVEGGFELLAPTPGPVRLEVWAASKELQVVRVEVTVDVAPR